MYEIAHGLALILGIRNLNEDEKRHRQTDVQRNRSAANETNEQIE